MTATFVASAPSTDTSLARLAIQLPPLKSGMKRWPIVSQNFRNRGCIALYSASVLIAGVRTLRGIRMSAGPAITYAERMQKYLLSMEVMYELDAG